MHIPRDDLIISGVTTAVIENIDGLIDRALVVVKLGPEFPALIMHNGKHKIRSVSQTAQKTEATKA